MGVDAGVVHGVCDICLIPVYLQVPSDVSTYLPTPSVSVCCVLVFPTATSPHQKFFVSFSFLFSSV